jgi:hypothetical protein
MGKISQGRGGTLGQGLALNQDLGILRPLPKALWAITGVRGILSVSVEYLSSTCLRDLVSKHLYNRLDIST